MRRKKFEYDVYNDNIVKIGKEQDCYYFEVGKEMTNDLAEAVSMLMRIKELNNNPIWNLEVKDIPHSEISPGKCLFWLSGGYSEWRSLENYNRPWIDCYLDFQEEFGLIIINIINRSKTLGEIRDNFNKYLNLPVLYDFAIRKNLTK